MTATFRRFGFWTIFAAMLFVCGCSSFDHDWNGAAGMKPENPVDITGRWQGTWASSVGTHHGDLRCLITRSDATNYRARYAATYGGIFHFEYEIALTGERKGEWIRFEGQADLARWPAAFTAMKGTPTRPIFLQPIDRARTMAGTP